MGVQISANQLIDIKNRANHWFKIPLGKKLSANHGQYISKYRGQGLDFSEVRRYSETDDVRHIDWRVTARAQKPFVKVYQQEQERPVSLVCDQSQSMFFGSQKQFKSVLAAKITMLLAWISVNNKDRIASYVFNDQNHSELPCRHQQKNAFLLADMISDYNKALTEPQKSNGQFKLQDSLKLLAKSHGHHIVIVSDFYQWNQSIKEQLLLLNQHNQIALVQCFDNLEKTPPPDGIYPIKLDQEVAMVDTGSKTTKLEWHQLFSKRSQQINAFCKTNLISHVSINTSEDEIEVANSLAKWWAS